MRKAQNLIKETTDSRTYKIAKYEKVGAAWCPYCPPYRGCNRSAKKGRPLYKQRSWKRFRKHQWREKII